MVRDTGVEPDGFAFEYIGPIIDKKGDIKGEIVRKNYLPIMPSNQHCGYPRLEEEQNV